MKEITAFEASDGKLFGTKEEAKNHEDRMMVRKFASQLEVTHSQYFDPYDAISAICAFALNNGFTKSRNTMEHLIEIVEGEK